MAYTLRRGGCVVKKQYRAAVFGATFLGLGAALCTGDCVVIDAGGVPGAEFVESDKVCRPVPLAPRTAPGRALLRALQGRGIVSETWEINAPSAVEAVTQRLAAESIAVVALAEVVSVVRAGELFAITILHAGMRMDFTAERILDTTTFGCVPGMGKPPLTEKVLCATVDNPDGRVMENLHHSVLRGTYTYTFPAELANSREDAIQALMEMEADFREKNMRIVSIAKDFAYAMKPFCRAVAAGWCWAPSVGYENPVAAFDQGCAMALGLQTHEETK